MNYKTNTVYAFAKHCMEDDEFNRGGLPAKEAYYLKKLGWNRESDELAEFYKALTTIQIIQEGKGGKL